MNMGTWDTFKQPKRQLTINIDGFTDGSRIANPDIRKEHLACVLYNVEPTTTNTLRLLVELKYILSGAHSDDEIIETLANHLDDIKGGMADDTELKAVLEVCPNIRHDNYESRNAHQGLMAYTKEGMQRLTWQGQEQACVDMALKHVYEPMTSYYYFNEPGFKKALGSMHIKMPKQIKDLPVLPFLGDLTFHDVNLVLASCEALVANGKCAFRVEHPNNMVGLLKIQDSTWHQDDAMGE